jgi:hypothetical protein
LPVQQEVWVLLLLEHFLNQINRKSWQELVKREKKSWLK